MICIKIFITAIFATLSLGLWADSNVFLRAVNEPIVHDLSDSCRQQGARLGDGQTLGNIKDPCLDEVVNFAPLNNRDALDEAELKVLALGNVIYFEIKVDDIVHPKILSGEQTKLQKVDFLRVHPKNQEIFVLDTTQQMLSVHATKYSGNVAPLRYFVDPRLKTASSFAFSEGDSKLLVFSRDNHLVLEYPIDLSDQSRKPAAAEKETSYKIKNPTKNLEIQDMWTHEGVLYALDSKASNFLVLKKNQNNTYEITNTLLLPRFSQEAPLTRMKVELDKDKMNFVFFDEYSRELEITLPED